TKIAIVFTVSIKSHSKKYFTFYSLQRKKKTPERNTKQMTSVVSKFITKTLCDHEGSLDFRRLEEKVARSYTVAESVLRAVLFDQSKIAIRQGEEKPTGGHIIPPDSLVVAKSSARLCQKKTGACARCDGLHLCRYYVCGECTFGLRCKNPHSLTTPNNVEVLRRHDLQDLTEKQLFQLLLQNDPYLLPEICSHYNKGSGLQGSCRFAASCSKLHMCQHYYQGDCRFGDGCKRAHRLDAQAMKLFQGYSQENINNLHKIYRNTLIISGDLKRPAAALFSVRAAIPANPPSDAERNEICLFFIRRKCLYKDKCARVHWHLPYRWQVLDVDGVTYKDLVDMENIERAYCDPARDTSCMDQPPAVDFMTMTYKGIPVRRLSTASSVSKPPHFILTTQWVWYWKDDGGAWLEFGQDDGGGAAAIASQTLENVYLADRDTEIPFSAGKHQYVLYFKDAAGSGRMYQQNVKHKTKREVRRRPRFLSTRDVEAQLKSTSSQSSSSSIAEIVPSTWDKTALPELGYRLVQLTSSAKEYSMIEMLFKRTMPQSKINSMHRIQNPSLWKVFQWQKEQMKKRNGGQLVNEKYLFHGTDESLIEPICEQNFDWRMCGVHGTAYGKGSYFARDSSYSNRFAKASGLNRTMFVALVLVGAYTKGSSSYVRPPPKGGSRDLYDSCVDSVSDPSIYVIFEKQQIYPEYLIKYS
uniref:Poly (ADP-ribose) polymerase family, member 12a n=1 Tax=Salarias fasciatus TaxID=181472 RepID=A0A672FEZ4_SALFA